ncbi:hypothetical protein Cni_G17329 [Canna indica]|uniref:Uncharacterized protein n=1 Tax=Canna indica TaxID=4628 RepID=A0AAQ3KMH2_9LILI|nr:hypothetical protein Cni_G17329 [Canna indica]
MASCTSEKNASKLDSYPMNLKDIQLDFDLEDVTCSICLDFPHNGVLLLCASYDKGCRPFICDTDQNHSNCLERFKSASGVPVVTKVMSATNGISMVCIQDISSSPSSRPTCPLCRGDVMGWLIIDEVCVYLNMKQRCCEEKHCTYVGNFFELQKHAKLKHPHSHPSKIDPVQQLNWENFQQSSEIIDVLSTIHAEVPRAIVLGDYVIEYGDADTVDEYEDFRRSRGNLWTSCISCKVFPNFRDLIKRRRSRLGVRRSSHGSSSDGSYIGEGSSRSVDIIEYRFAEIDDELPQTGVSTATPIVIPSYYRYGRHRSHVYDH